MTKRLRGGEDGASAVLVAISIFLLFGAAAIAIDLGSAWETKRNLVSDTDSAALAAAAQILGSCAPSTLDAAEATAKELVGANLGESVDDGRFEFDADCTNGRATVSYTQPAQTTVAGAIGVNELPVFSSSTADADFVGGGLRPFSVCMTDPEVIAWLAGDGNYDDLVPLGLVTDLTGLPYPTNWQVFFSTKTWKDDNPGGCGGAAGNWGLVCYEKTWGQGTVCNTDAVVDMLLNGYGGDVDLGTPSPVDGDCDPATDGTDDDCDARTGPPANSLNGALSTILCAAATPADDCEYRFPILGTDGYTGGPGGTADLNPTHFIGVVLRGFRLTGPPTGQFLIFELTDIFDSGRSSVVNRGALDRLPPVICDVDGSPDTLDVC